MVYLYQVDGVIEQKTKDNKKEIKMKTMKRAIRIENGTMRIVRETEKAFLLSSIDQNQHISAWFPKSALVYLYDIKFANGTICKRYEVKDWFYRKMNHLHNVVIGRVI